jgi:ABC-2 type transport system permease protein
MKALLIARREVAGYLDLPIAYVVLPAFLLLAGVWFFVFDSFFAVGQATLRPLFELVPFLFTFFVPAITMRLFAEERRAGTLEVLLTWPVGDWEVVVGKFLGAMALVGAATALTLPYAITVALLGPLDWGPVIGGYVGLLLLGAAYVALGLAASVWTANQIVAFIAAFLTCFAFYVVGRALPLVPEGLARVLESVSFELRFDHIARGVLDSRDVVFFASVVAAALGLSAETLRARRWR